MKPGTVPNFDRVARIYRWAEYLSLGPLLERTRKQFLPQLAGCRRALVLGDGDGRFLARLMAEQTQIEALAVDGSAAMLELLRQRCLRVTKGSEDRLRTVHGSALTVAVPERTDLIVTHFFLDCLQQLEVDELADRLAGSVEPGTLWVVSEFGEPPSPLWRPLARLYVRGLYLAFRVLTGLRVTLLPNPQRALASAGFARVGRHERLGGLLYAELWRRV